MTEPVPRGDEEKMNINNVAQTSKKTIRFVEDDVVTTNFIEGFQQQIGNFSKSVVWAIISPSFSILTKDSYSIAATRTRVALQVRQQHMMTKLMKMQMGDSNQ